jgi:hypothetical protein
VSCEEKRVRVLKGFSEGIAEAIGSERIKWRRHGTSDHIPGTFSQFTGCSWEVYICFIISAPLSNYANIIGADNRPQLFIPIQFLKGLTGPASLTL